MTALVLFALTYLGIAFGRLPGLAIDRTGIALLEAIAMVVSGVMTTAEAFDAVDIPTILLLYSLMVISAQLRLGGFYAWSARGIIPLLGRPRLFLGASMLLSAGLSALLANDIVCLAFTPVLIHGLVAARLNPVPFLLGLAIASNLFSNVPAVMLLIQFLDPGDHRLWYSLAVSSTFAGNFILLGSIANLIVVEQAAAEGVILSFRNMPKPASPLPSAAC